MSLSEDDIKRRKKALEVLFNCSTDEMDSADSNNRLDESRTLIFGRNSFVSFVRGMDCNYDDRSDTIVHSTPINSKNKTTCLGSPYLELQSLNIDDSDFFDSETGKQMILKDQVSYEGFSMQKTDCTGCSSWTPCSRKNMSSMSIPLSGFKQKESVSVGEFISKFSETVSFSDAHKKQNIFADCFTSTPKEKRKSRSMSSLMDMESEEFSGTLCASLDYSTNESLATIGTPTSIKPLNFSIPRCTENSEYSKDFHYFIGSTNRKNIMSVRKEERRTPGSDETVSFDSLQTDKTGTMTNASGATGSDTTTFALKSGTLTLTSNSMSRSCYDQWFLDPQTVLLDTNKGNRVRLINNSTKNLKFKTSFDSRIINICPLSGSVPAMSQIGLRLLISKYAKKKNENFEDDVKVTIGKNEKNIHVKFVKSGKSKSSKDRSYILY